MIIVLLMFFSFQDSAYMALSASSLREIVKPEKIADYQRGLTGLCDVQVQSRCRPLVP
jgi:hypothetical protein